MQRRAGVTFAGFALAALLAATDAPSPQPDVAIFANVRARELRFETVPQVTVRFTGEGNATEWTSDRTNLPDDVQPRVLYRDIGIRLRITSTLPNIEAILDEALGPAETPKP